MRYRVEVSTEKQLQEAIALPQIEYVYAPMSIVGSQSSVADCIIVPPVFIGNDEPKMLMRLRELREMGYTRGLAHTIGHIPVIREAGMTVHGGFRLNITNSAALNQYEDLGLADTILSVEISLNRVKSLKSAIPTGLVVYGKLPMMLLRNPGIWKSGVQALVDRKGKSFLLKQVNGAGEAELLNPNTLVLSDRMREFSELDFAVLSIPPGESVKKILSLYLNGESPKGNFTRGLY
ncbi:MAG: U32 family peptidase [Oscillospiraceae bacterium]|nr:U32 family peptidase [Oscillospiraceae bacterium]